MGLDSKFLVLMAGVVWLAGCMAPDQALKYAPAPGLTKSTAATLIGSDSAKYDWEGDHVETSIDSIDNRFTGANSHTKVLVAPGLHAIDINDFIVGLGYGGSSGDAIIAINLEAGKTYIARSTTPQLHWTFPLSRTVSIWLEDSGGQKVSDNQLVQLGGKNADPDPIFIPVK